MTTVPALFSCGELESLGLAERFDLIAGDPEVCRRLDNAIALRGLGADELAYAISSLLPLVIAYSAGARRNKPAKPGRLADQRRQPFTAVLDRLDLADLARSVLMEQRGDWRMPGVPVRDRGKALGLFWEACGQAKPSLETALGRAFGSNQRLSVDDIISDTWLSALDTYWSPEAEERFLGLTSITGMLVSTAVWKAKGLLKRAQSRPTLSLTPKTPDPYTFDTPDDVSDADLAESIRAMLRGTELADRSPLPAAGVLGRLLARHGEMAALEAPLAAMKGAQAGFSRRYHVEGKSNKEICEIEGHKPPYVTGVLIKAWLRLGQSRSLLNALTRIARGGPRGGGDRPTMDNHEPDSQPLHGPRRKSDGGRRRRGPSAAIPGGVLEALVRLTAIREGKESLEGVDDETLLHWVSLLDHDGIVAILAADASRGATPAGAAGRGWRALPLAAFRSYLRGVTAESVRPQGGREDRPDFGEGESPGISDPGDVRDGPGGGRVAPPLSGENGAIWSVSETGWPALPGTRSQGQEAEDTAVGEDRLPGPGAQPGGVTIMAGMQEKAVIRIIGIGAGLIETASVAAVYEVGRQRFALIDFPGHADNIENLVIVTTLAASTGDDKESAPAVAAPSTAGVERISYFYPVIGSCVPGVATEAGNRLPLFVEGVSLFKGQGIDGTLRAGLGFGACDVGVVTNIGEGGSPIAVISGRGCDDINPTTPTAVFLFMTPDGVVTVGSPPPVRTDRGDRSQVLFAGGNSPGMSTLVNALMAAGTAFGIGSEGGGSPSAGRSHPWVIDLGTPFGAGAVFADADREERRPVGVVGIPDATFAVPERTWVTPRVTIHEFDQVEPGQLAGAVLPVGTILDPCLTGQPAFADTVGWDVVDEGRLEFRGLHPCGANIFAGPGSGTPAYLCPEYTSGNRGAPGRLDGWVQWVAPPVDDQPQFYSRTTGGTTSTLGLPSEADDVANIQFGFLVTYADTFNFAGDTGLTGSVLVPGASATIAIRGAGHTPAEWTPPPSSSGDRATDGRTRNVRRHRRGRAGNRSGRRLDRAPVGPR